MMKLRLIIILFLLFSIKIKVFSQSGFCPYQPSCSPFPTGNLPNDIVSGDFNNDGFNDLAVEIQGSDSVTIYHGNNAGCFSYAYSKKTGSNPLAITKADFNNDGKMDIALACASGNDVSVLINNGSGFNNYASFSVGSFPIAITTGDINNDGNRDIVTANNYAGITVLKGKGDGTFFPAVDYTVGSYPRSVTIGDFNSDGFADIVAGHDNSAFLSLLLNTGTGNFNTPTNFSNYYCPYLTTKDMNNDGIPDLIASIAGTATALGVYICNGAGGFSAPTIHSTGVPAAAYRLVVEDINYDGVIDIAASCFFTSGMLVYLGPSLNPTAQFIGGSSSYLTSGDFNSDGKIDFATANRGSNDVSIIMNNSVLLNTTTTSNSICIGNSVTINASGATSYTWSTGSNSSSISVSPNTTTTYTVTGSSGSCSNTKTITINVSSYQTPTITITNGGHICSGSNAYFMASGANTYTWSSGANTSSTSVLGINTGTTAIPLTQTVTGTDINGCVSSATSSVGINPLPQATITASNDSICIGQSDTLIANFSPNTTSYIWLPIVISSTSVIITPTTTTIYGLSIMNAIGCTNVASITITITVLSCVGISEPSNINTLINVFPNPTTGEFILRTKQKDNSIIEIYNSIGQKLLSQKITEPETKLNLKEFADGIYFVKVFENGKSIYHSKLIKQ